MQSNGIQLLFAILRFSFIVACGCLLVACCASFAASALAFTLQMVDVGVVEVGLAREVHLS